MEGLEAGKAVVIYSKTANRSEVARLMLQARGYEAHVMEGGSEAWSPRAFTTPDGQPGPVA
ncbi:MAG: rhodanese-like domain-containing protein [Actinomycetota bacterium]